jgi:hypothetical protein
MSVVVNRGLVAKKRVQAARKIPRLLMGMLAELPTPTPTKQEAALESGRALLQEAMYRDSDHFVLDPAVEKIHSTPSKELT